MPHLLRTTALAGAAALLAGLAPAADMTFTPASGSGVVIYSAPNAPAVQVQPDGKVQVPGLPGTPATATAAVCHDAAGTLQRCDPAALTGPAGPMGLQGPPGQPGPQGQPGAAGADGANGTAGANGTHGQNALLRVTPEPAGTNCATSGQKVEVGVDANGNDTLDAGEIDDAQTAYVCNGAKGDPGQKGDPGLKGDPGTNGNNGLPGAPGTNGAPGASAVLTMETVSPGSTCTNGGQRITYGIAGAATETRYVCNGVNGAPGAPGSNGGLSGVVHGCFTDDTPRGTNPLNIVSGATLYTVGKSVIASVPTYTIGFSAPFADTAYTVLLDGRSATGRALALKATKTVASLVVPQGWLDEGLEANDPLNICFMLTR